MLLLLLRTQAGGPPPPPPFVPYVEGAFNLSAAVRGRIGTEKLLPISGEVINGLDDIVRRDAGIFDELKGKGII